MKGKWKPSIFEKVYWIGIIQGRWENCEFEKNLIKQDNCFQTKEEAEKKLKKIKKVLRG